MFALLVLAAADFLVVLDGLIVSVALPSIQRDLGFSQAGLQWVVNGDLLAFGGVLVAGWTCRRPGGAAAGVHRRAGGVRYRVVGVWPGPIGGGAGGRSGWPGARSGADRAGGAGSADRDLAEGSARDRALAIWSAVSSVGVPAGACSGAC
jgi:MFS family permease